jgi:hypothetical protein
MSTVNGGKEKTDAKLNQLDQLKKFTSVIADTADFESIREFKPRDATTNPSLVYAATQKDNYSQFLEEVLISFYRRAKEFDAASVDSELKSETNVQPLDDCSADLLKRIVDGARDHLRKRSCEFAKVRRFPLFPLRPSRETFSDKIGHSNCVILRDSCKAQIYSKCS